MTNKKKRNNKASVRELIHFRLNTWVRELPHELASSKLKMSSDLYNVINKLLSSNDKIRTAKATISYDKLIKFIQDILDKTDYRFDIKTFDSKKYDELKSILTELNIAYDEFDPNKRGDINLTNDGSRLGLWLEPLNYQFNFDYKIVINTGYADKPTILLNIVMET